MSQIFATSLFEAFCEIAFHEHRTVMRFFEEQKTKIHNLQVEEFTIIEWRYTIALFEVGDFKSVIPHAKNVLENSLLFNIHFYQGKDIVFETMYRLAAAHLNLNEVLNAKNIALQLIQMYPYEPLVKELYRRILYNHRPKYQNILEASSIFLVLTCAGILLIEMLYVKNYEPAWSFQIGILRNILWVLAGTFAIVARGSREAMAYLEADKAITKAKLKKEKAKNLSH
jgi:hypothetical protein